MPVRNAFDVPAWLQAHPAPHKLVRIVLSSSTDPGDIARARAPGAHDYKVKPLGLRKRLALVMELQAR